MSSVFWASNRTFKDYTGQVLGLIPSTLALITNQCDYTLPSLQSGKVQKVDHGDQDLALV
jgi:hypothetical protein